MADEPLTDPDGPDILAGEYALGVLEGEELVAAQRQFLSDRDFADRVGWWRLKLANMAETAGEVEPSADVWPAILRRLDGLRPDEAGGSGMPIAKPTEHPLAPDVRTGFSGWSLGAAMAGAAALAAALTFVMVQPAVTPPATPVETQAPVTGDRLIAQLSSEDGRLTLAGYVDPRADELSLNLGGFAPGDEQATELWVVPAGGAPQSLGLVPASGTFARQLSEAERAALVEGASLAVTYEDETGAPHAAPTTEILLIGDLSRV
ncbi:MAG: anti-sigma factor [Alteraurantiacibacter sp.]